MPYGSHLSLISHFCVSRGNTTRALPTFVPCQIQKPVSSSPLTGCPRERFSSRKMQAIHTKIHQHPGAIASLPQTGAATILIAAGSYQETLNVTRTGPLTLLGQLPQTIANASSPNLNLVQVWNTAFVMTGQDDASSAVLTVAPNLAGALIGAGPTGAPLQPVFGNVDFKAYNIDFQNRAANFAISQALVTDISYANASFYGCAFASFQDTWYTGRNASTYVVDSVIFGQTDCVFQFWFQNIILANRACGGGISPDANSTTATNGLCFLGRPWNDLATTVYLSTVMDASVRPAGWEPFDSARPTIMNTTFYAEFNSTGPGGNTSQPQASNFTINGVFLEHPKWIDFGYLF
ncbi:pectin lyase-like protein [Mycena leptocephala]|nr:pectin lyase-like protein [Mycena leptocephala]